MHACMYVQVIVPQNHSLSLNIHGEARKIENSQIFTLAKNLASIQHPKKTCVQFECD